MFITTNQVGTPLKNILENKDYPYIEARIRYKINGGDNDIFFGVFAYLNGQIVSLDQDDYSLDDLYVDWKEIKQGRKTILTVWMQGEVNE